MTDWAIVPGMHRNKYMEGARRVRERPLFKVRTLWLLIFVSAAAYLGFWYFAVDIDAGSSDGTGIAQQLADAMILIGVVVFAGIGVGTLIALMRRLGGKSDLLSRLENDKPKSESSDPE